MRLPGGHLVERLGLLLMFFPGTAKRKIPLVPGQADPVAFAGPIALAENITHFRQALQ